MFKAAVNNCVVVVVVVVVVDIEEGEKEEDGAEMDGSSDVGRYLKEKKQALKPTTTNDGLIVACMKKKPYTYVGVSDNFENEPGHDPETKSSGNVKIENDDRCGTDDRARVLAFCRSIFR